MSEWTKDFEIQMVYLFRNVNKVNQLQGKIARFPASPNATRLGVMNRMKPAAFVSMAEVKFETQELDIPYGYSKRVM